MSTYLASVLELEKKGERKCNCLRGEVIELINLAKSLPPRSRLRFPASKFWMAVTMEGISGMRAISSRGRRRGNRPRPPPPPRLKAEPEQKAVSAMNDKFLLFICSYYSPLSFCSMSPFLPLKAVFTRLSRVLPWARDPAGMGSWQVHSRSEPRTGIRRDTARMFGNILKTQRRSLKYSALPSLMLPRLPPRSRALRSLARGR